MENIEEEITHLVREIALEKGKSQEKSEKTSQEDTGSNAPKKTS